MKRSICIILIFAIHLLFTGCSTTQEPETVTVAFYYIHNEFEYGDTSGIITPSLVTVTKSRINYRELLEKYFNGPTNYDCISPFPAGITLEDIHIDNDKAQLLLSPHMATISGSMQSVALACLTRTVIEMTNVKTVQIQIQNNQIHGMDSITLTLNSFSYWDDVEPSS